MVAKTGTNVRKKSLKIAKRVISKKKTTQWPKEKVHKDKQRSTKNTHTTKDRLIRTPLKTGGELMCSGRVSCSCITGHIVLKRA